MPRVVSLPSRLSGYSMPSVASAAFGEGRPEDNIVQFDFSQVTFVEPCGITLLANLIEWLHSQSVIVQFINHTSGNVALRYLDDAAFFERYLRTRLSQSSSLRSTTIPLERVTHEQSHAWLRSTLMPWLAGHIQINQASLHTMQTSLSEIFNNIKDHTTYDIGSVFAQFFPKKKTITISLADFGAGVPETVRRILPHLADGDAIIQAVADGFTSKSRPTNQGVGLAYLLNTAVVQNGGTVTIFSQRASVFFYRASNGGLVANASALHVGFYPGTTIEINLRTDTIQHVPEDEEDLTW